jgi:hypothetical protein
LRRRSTTRLRTSSSSRPSFELAINLGERISQFAPCNADAAGFGRHSVWHVIPRSRSQDGDASARWVRIRHWSRYARISAAISRLRVLGFSVCRSVQPWPPTRCRHCIGLGGPCQLVPNVACCSHGNA